MGGTLSCSCRCNDAGMTSQVPHKERVHVHKISDCARLLVAKPFSGRMLPSRQRTRSAPRN